MHAKLLILPLLAMAAVGQAHAKEAPFTVEVDIRQEGVLVNSTSLTMADGETARADMHREIPYVVSTQGGTPEADTDTASVDVTQRIRVTPTGRDGGVALAADIRMSQLIGYAREASGDRVVSIPQVSDVSLSVKDGVMTPEGSAWVYESDTLDNGMKVRIVARR